MKSTVQAEFVLSAASPEHFPALELPEVALLGRSNVGKSSLINRVLGQDGLAFTSSRPGCTRLINFYRVENALSVVDLPGYGYAAVSRAEAQVWKSLIESYLVGRESLKLALLLLDGRRGWMERDLELKEWLEFYQKPYLVVVTKVDKLNQKEHHHGMKAIQERMTHGEPLPFSAVTGRGARELWQAIWKIKTQ